MLLYELVERLGDGFGKTLQYFDAQNMADELQKPGSAILVNLLEQLFGNVRMFEVQQFRQFSGFAFRDLFAVPDFQQDGIAVCEFHDQ